MVGGVSGGGLEGLTNSAIQEAIDASIVEAFAAFGDFQFAPLQLENPNNSDWAVNALAPAAADSINAGLTVRLFDATTEEGVGFLLQVPATATDMTISFLSRASIAPAGARTVGLNLYQRSLPDNAAVDAWSGGLQLTDIDIPNSNLFQADSQIITLATLGITVGEVTQFELTRINPTGGVELVGDWVLAHIRVSFS